MLSVTDPAVAAIRMLTSAPGVPGGSGLRIVHHDTAGGFELSIAAEPDAGDEVIETGGIRVFLQASAAAMLGGKELSARIARDDDVVFSIDD
jgi:iron-sulfur cluster assembly protein